METLPNELIANILHCLEDKDIVCFSLTSHRNKLLILDILRRREVIISNLGIRESIIRQNIKYLLYDKLHISDKDKELSENHLSCNVRLIAFDLSNIFRCRDIEEYINSTYYRNVSGVTGNFIAYLKLLPNPDCWLSEIHKECSTIRSMDSCLHIFSYQTSCKITKLVYNRVRKIIDELMVKKSYPSLHYVPSTLHDYIEKM